MRPMCLLVSSHRTYGRYSQAYISLPFALSRSSLQIGQRSSASTSTMLVRFVVCSDAVCVSPLSLLLIGMRAQAILTGGAILRWMRAELVHCLSATATVCCSLCSQSVAVPTYLTVCGCCDHCRVKMTTESGRREAFSNVKQKNSAFSVSLSHVHHQLISLVVVCVASLSRTALLAAHSDFRTLDEKVAALSSPLCVRAILIRTFCFAVANTGAKRSTR